jgi:hypothetical protein
MLGAGVGKKCLKWKGGSITGYVAELVLIDVAPALGYQA